MVNRDTIRALRREAQREGVLVQQTDGTTKAFPRMEVMRQVYLWRLAKTGGQELPESDVLDAYRIATPESKRMLNRIAARADNGLDDLEHWDSTELKEVEDLSEP
jgi:hypothetical protein